MNDAHMETLISHCMRGIDDAYPNEYQTLIHAWLTLGIYVGARYGRAEAVGPGALDKVLDPMKAECLLYEIAVNADEAR